MLVEPLLYKMINGAIQILKYILKRSEVKYKSFTKTVHFFCFLSTCSFTTFIVQTAAVHPFNDIREDTQARTYTLIYLNMTC